MPTRLMTAKETAERMGISLSSFYRLPDSEKPPVTEIGRFKRYNEESFTRYLKTKEGRR